MSKSSTGKTYSKKTFTKDEWKLKLIKDKQSIPIITSINELSIPKLLLNYFIINAYEDSSCRMAKELGLIKNNKDLIEFNDLFKINERSKIIHSIKLGKISNAMDLINNHFGFDILQNNNNYTTESNLDTKNVKNDKTEQSENEINSNDDLHFKLLLLNLTEMIRNNKNNKNNNSNNDKIDDKEFIINLINYSKEKLAPKALNNKKHMKQLELIMTLLLLPQDLSIKLPENLNKLYSLSLRTKIANLINKKLLQSIYPQITNQSKFTNLIQSTENINIMNYKLSNFNSIIKTNLRSEDFQKDENTRTDIDKSQVLSSSSTFDYAIPKTSSTSYWNETKENILTNNDTPQEKIDISDFQFESKLSQIIKLWVWSENQLHSNNIGVPRIQNNA